MMAGNGKPFGQKLLDHDGLMTPVINRFFGPVRAVQTHFSLTPETYIRRSSIIQKSHECVLLDAELEISRKNLPDALITALQETEILFGQLLNTHRIEAIVTARRVDFENGRWGRQLDMLDKQDGKLLCKVRERLAPDEQLLKHCIISHGSSLV